MCMIDTKHTQKWTFLYNIHIITFFQKLKLSSTDFISSCLHCFTTLNYTFVLCLCNGFRYEHNERQSSIYIEQFFSQFTQFTFIIISNLRYFFLSKCNHSIAFDTFYKEINFLPTKVGWIGSGCSLATEPTAELTQYYNITQVVYINSLCTCIVYV